MQGLASFDRWLTQRVPPSASAEVPSSARYLVGPAHQLIEVERDAGTAELLRAAHGATPADWLGLLAEEARGHRTRWRLALWTPNDPQGPRWIGPALKSHPGQRSAALREAALELALGALWGQGWRLVDAVAPATA